MSASSFSTYDVTSSLVRDVDNVIRNIDPTDTPFQSSVGSGKVKQKLFEWIEEVLPTSVSTNAQVEGFDFPAASQAEVTYRTNVIQTFARTARVTGILDEADLYGRRKEFARHKALVSKALKIDLEKTLVGITARAAVAGDDSTARLMANMGQQIHADNIVAGGTAALTEAMVLAASALLYTSGVQAEFIMIKPSDSLVFANFAYKNAGATYPADRSRDMGASKKIVNSVEVYEGPLMALKVQKNRHLVSSYALLYDPEMWEVVSYRSWKSQDIPPTGDWRATSFFGDYSLKHRHFHGSALINALT
jgi:hypothetical protein